MVKFVHPDRVDAETSLPRPEPSGSRVDRSETCREVPAREDWPCAPLLLAPANERSDDIRFSLALSRER